MTLTMLREEEAEDSDTDDDREVAEEIGGG